MGAKCSRGRSLPRKCRAASIWNGNGHMDLRQPEMFRAVAEQGTFTKAAARLHVSQSAVSRQVQLLEKELGGSLLRRSAKGVTLTEAGHLLLPMTHRLHRPPHRPPPNTPTT